MGMENVLKLCLHSKDFAVKEKWACCTLSHVKLPCDGVGEVVPINVQKEAYSEQLLTELLVLSQCTNFAHLA